MGLGQYHKKRDFSKTPEPRGGILMHGMRAFVIQKHAASHLHYDFRLELQGSLKSWAVPKGPSLDPSVKRLAIQVEDHPLEYGSFEGIIPKGQYGGGTVMLWDRGTWEPLDKHPLSAYKKGHLRFELHGEKLQGRWDLIRFKDDKQWFLVKFKDEHAINAKEEDITETMGLSVASALSMEEIAGQKKNTWDSAKAKALKKPLVPLPKGLEKKPFPEFFSPQLATLVDKAPEGDNWLHEIKWDGYRILAFKKGKHVVLKSRNNKDWTENFPSIVNALKQLPFEGLVLDGEVVVLDHAGHSSFQLLQNALKSSHVSGLHYFLFDLLYFEHYDLRHLPLLERKALLKKLLSTKIALLEYSDHILSEGRALYDYACEQGLEGIVSKRADGAYRSSRSKDWLKIKCSKRQEFVIGGYTSPRGCRKHFGSLFLGVYNEKGALEFSGNVGTGFNEKTLNALYPLLLENQSQTNPFKGRPPGFTSAHWLLPRLVCEVEFTEWTDEGHVRHPSFKGLRLDKKAAEVIRERAEPLANLKSKKTSSLKSHIGIILTNPQKILYPEDGISKQAIWDYYETVADKMLPFIENRPLTLLRCPEQYQTCFYQRHRNAGTAKSLYSIEDAKNSDHKPYLYLKDREGLLALVQMSVLEIHTWGSQIQDLDKPDVIVLDLDPAPDVPWSKVVAGAKEVRDYLREYRLRSFVKSTGGKGLHVVLPINPEYDWEEVKLFTQVFVQFLEKLKPNSYISKMSKAKRKGKIFVDYLRNQRAATAIAPYSTRARPHASVATPLDWEELGKHREDTSYTIETLPQRLAQLREDPWKDFWLLKQSLNLDSLQ